MIGRHRTAPRSDTSERREVARDGYYTPRAVAAVGVRLIRDYYDPTTVIDPHVGGGDLLRADLWERDGRTPYRIGIDLAPTVGPAAVDEIVTADWLTWPVEAPWFTAIIANPPFRGWDQHVERMLWAIDEQRIQCAAVLLQEGALSSPAMLALRRRPVEIVHIVGRVRFGGPAMDAHAQERAALVHAQGREPRPSDLRSSPAHGHVWALWTASSRSAQTIWVSLTAAERSYGVSP